MCNCYNITNINPVTSVFLPPLKVYFVDCNGVGQEKNIKNGETLNFCVNDSINTNSINFSTKNFNVTFDDGSPALLNLDFTINYVGSSQQNLRVGVAGGGGGVLAGINVNATWPGQNCGLVNPDPANGYPSTDSFYVQMSSQEFAHTNGGFSFSVYNNQGQPPPPVVSSGFDALLIDNFSDCGDNTTCSPATYVNPNGFFPYYAPLKSTPNPNYTSGGLGPTNAVYEIPQGPAFGPTQVLTNVTYKFGYFFRIPTLNTWFTPQDVPSLSFQNTNGCAKIMVTDIVLIDQMTYIPYFRLSTVTPSATTTDGYSIYAGDAIVNGINSGFFLGWVVETIYDYSQCITSNVPFANYEIGAVPIDAYWCYGCCPDPYNTVSGFANGGTSSSVSNAGSLIINNCPGNSYSATTNLTARGEVDSRPFFTPPIIQVFPLNSVSTGYAQFNVGLNNNTETTLSTNQNEIIFSLGGTYDLTYLFEVEVDYRLVSSNPSSVRGNINLDLYDTNDNFLASIDFFDLDPNGGALQPRYVLSGYTPLSVYALDKLKFMLKSTVTTFTNSNDYGFLELKLTGGFICIGGFGSFPPIPGGGGGGALSGCPCVYKYWIAGINCLNNYGEYLEPIDGDC